MKRKGLGKRRINYWIKLIYIYGWGLVHIFEENNALFGERNKLELVL